MKKKIAMALAVGLVFSCLQGCGSSDTQKKDSTTTTEQTNTNQENNLNVEQEDTDTENEATGEETALKHYDPMPEILDATWGDGMFQVADMVFCINNVMSMDEVAAIIETSETDLQLIEYQNPDYDENFPPQLHAMDKEGNATSLFEWKWHSVDNQRYYDVAEGEEGWYLSGFYVGADIEALVGCDRDSWYIDGGIPVKPTPGTYNKTEDDLINEFKSFGAIEWTEYGSGNTFYIYMKHHDVSEIPPAIYNQSGYFTVPDHKWTGTTDSKGNERFSCIDYSFNYNNSTGVIESAAIYYGEPVYKQELLDLIK